MTRINKMKQMIKGCLVAAGLWMFSLDTMAQLSTNPDKFLGNITTGWPGSMDYNGFKYSYGNFLGNLLTHKVPCI